MSTLGLNLERLATRYTGEIQLALWVVWLALLAATVLTVVRKVQGGATRPRTWILGGVVVVLVSGMAAWIIPQYLESIDLEPLVLAGGGAPWLAIAAGAS